MSDIFFKLWFMLIAAIGIAWVGFIAWMIYRIVIWLTA